MWHNEFDNVYLLYLWIFLLSWQITSVTSYLSLWASVLNIPYPNFRATPSRCVTTLRLCLVFVASWAKRRVFSTSTNLSELLEGFTNASLHLYARKCIHPLVNRSLRQWCFLLFQLVFTSACSFSLLSSNYMIICCQFLSRFGPSITLVAI